MSTPRPKSGYFLPAGGRVKRTVGSIDSADSIDSIDFNWVQIGPGIGHNWVQFLVPIGLILVFTLADGQCENKGILGFGSRQG